jgi:hypothetical protein
MTTEATHVLAPRPLSSLLGEKANDQRSGRANLFHESLLPPKSLYDSVGWLQKAWAHRKWRLLSMAHETYFVVAMGAGSDKMCLIRLRAYAFCVPTEMSNWLRSS